MSDIDPWIWIAAHGGPLAAARLPHTPPEVFAELGKSPDGAVRYAVAENSQAPVSVLLGLANDAHGEIAGAALGKLDRLAMRLSPATLAALEKETRRAKRKFLLVRMVLASNPAAPVEVLEALREDRGFTGVRHALARNPSTPQATLRELAQNDPEDRIRESAQKNLRTQARLEALNETD